MFGNATKMTCQPCTFIASNIHQPFPEQFEPKVITKSAVHPVVMRRNGVLNEDVTVYPEQIHAIRDPTSLLPGTIIDAYFTLLVSHPSCQGCDFISSATTSMIRNNADYPVMAARKERWFNSPILFAPIHADSHWMLAVIFPHLKRIEILNSIKGYATEKVKGFTDSWDKFSGHKHQVITPSFPQQTNNYDCGILPC